MFITTILTTVFAVTNVRRVSHLYGDQVSRGARRQSRSPTCCQTARSIAVAKLFGSVLMTAIWNTDRRRSPAKHWPIAVANVPTIILPHGARDRAAQSSTRWWPEVTFCSFPSQSACGRGGVRCPSETFVVVDALYHRIDVRILFYCGCASRFAVNFCFTEAVKV